MVRVTAIPYLNTAPFVFGLKQKALNCVDLSFATPAAAAYQLQNNLCDIAIVPVAAIPALTWYEIVGTYCIGALSTVASVLLCSQVPVEQIREVALDSESRTSVRLAQLLLRDYWHVSPHYTPLPLDHRRVHHQSVVLIGDKALLHGANYPYVYDLSEHWFRWTGKPFVFAAWVANKPLPADFAERFNQALAYGVSHIDETLISEVGERFPHDLAKNYLTHNISYPLDAAKRQALQLFWRLLETV